MNCEPNETAIVSFQRDGYPCSGFMGAVVTVRIPIMEHRGWHWIIDGAKACLKNPGCVCNALPDFALKPLRGGDLGPDDDGPPTTGEAKDLPAPQRQVDRSGVHS